MLTFFRARRRISTRLLRVSPFIATLGCCFSASRRSAGGGLGSSFINKTQPKLRIKRATKTLQHHPADARLVTGIEFAAPYSFRYLLVLQLDGHLRVHRVDGKLWNTRPPGRRVSVKGSAKKHEHGSIECIVAFLGPENWSSTKVVCCGSWIPETAEFNRRPCAGPAGLRGSARVVLMIVPHSRRGD